MESPTSLLAATTLVARRPITDPLPPDPDPGGSRMYRWISIAAVLVVAVALAACGGTGGSAGQATVSTGDAGVQTGGKPAGDDGTGTLSLGQRAVTDYVDYGAKDQRPTKVGVSVVKVRKGNISDFKDFNLDAKERKTVPYYVDAKFENLGRFALTRHLMRPSLEDSDGTEYRPITLIVLSGTFKPCPDYSDAKLKPGQSFTGCSPILLPKGKQFGRVRFEGDVTKDPIFWSAQ
jgi:hypothetical protein